MKFPISSLQKASLILMATMLWAEMSHAQVCAQWSSPRQLGALPMLSVREASGACLSRAQHDRAYWINDSGNKTVVHYGPLSGEDMQSFEVKDFVAADSEALVCGRCDEGPCLILGDIGDNPRKRKTIKVAFLSDRVNLQSAIKPYRDLELVYPDGPHDAEAMFLSPEGDLMIVTKELNFKSLKASSAVLYRLEKRLFHSDSRKPLTLQRLGELPLPDWFRGHELRGLVVTDAAVNEKRQMLGLLTYASLVEIPLAKLKDIQHSARWQKDVDFHLVPLKALAQQETVFYTADDTVIWSTEYFPPQAPIFSMTCEKTGP